MKRSMMAVCSLLLGLVPGFLRAGVEGPFTYSVANGGAIITDFDDGYSGPLVIPDTLGGYPVTSIGAEAFSGCRGLTSVTIPNSVTSIGQEAFAWCSGLTSLTIGSGLAAIGWSAFRGCEQLTEFAVDGGNADYSSEGGVLFNKAKTELVLFPPGRGGTYTIPQGVTFIGDYAFQWCSGLTSVAIPNSVTSIGNWAFYGCRGLTSVTIPNSVTSIGQEAFYECSGLTSVTIGSGLATIGWSAFRGCEQLTEFAVDGGNPHYSSEGGVLFNKDKTELVLFPPGRGGAYTISQSVISIGAEAFYGCRGLTSVTIPNSVTSTGWTPFLHHGWAKDSYGFGLPQDVVVLGYCCPSRPLGGGADYATLPTCPSYAICGVIPPSA